MAKNSNGSGKPHVHKYKNVIPAPISTMTGYPKSKPCKCPAQTLSKAIGGGKGAPGNR